MPFGDALAFDLLGEAGLGHGDAVLGEDVCDVEIRPGLEGDGEIHRAVVGADARHVNHPLDPIDLLLDGGSDGLGDGAGVGTRIDRGNLHGGRGDVGITRHRQGDHRDEPDEHDHDGNDRGEDRASNEEEAEHGAGDR